ncbi:MAG TPA: diaminopimelate epimerase [Candidatus Krumholzibacteriaceae bacterium]|nr:diaminopimelate epimerase [Candidatus Krumholzibacteriaceae bacterium]
MEKKIPFSKMHGAGNDFIVIDDMNERFRSSPVMISALCDRHFGIGADGLILVQPSKAASFRMVYYNNDGSRAGMCGNGARCAAKFAFDKSIINEYFEFETDSGIIKGKIEKERVTISLADVSGVKLNIDTGENTPVFSFALAGVPHAALICDDAREISNEDFLSIIHPVRYNRRFKPHGTNVNIVKVINRNYLFYRTYERGVEDETLACGTGAVAIAVITSHLGMTESPVSCETSGGDILTVSFDQTDSGAENCLLSGPAVESFSGYYSADHYRG